MEWNLDDITWDPVSLKAEWLRTDPLSTAPGANVDEVSDPQSPIYDGALNMPAPVARPGARRVCSEPGETVPKHSPRTFFREQVGYVIFTLSSSDDHTVAASQVNSREESATRRALFESPCFLLSHIATS